MDHLINDIFGDESITLDCNSGECMHYTQVPGYEVSHNLTSDLQYLIADIGNVRSGCRAY